MNIAPDQAIELEDKLHPLTAMLSFKVMENELKNILEPCIVHSNIDRSIKSKLERKKAALEKQKKVNAV